MQTFQEIKSIRDTDSFINSSPLTFIYLSKEKCSVCHALLPQIRAIMDNYPKIKLGHISVSQLEEISGYFSIFTVPVLILFIEGKEYLREARFVHVDEFDKRLKKIYESYYSH
ncbi:thioredoxin family protein [Salirhabdus salicampi]|uniref:thioredoxin family protein n=1 Tax=Salirhabdus salicampi TaxID=476102 RepID=UPI0020C4EEDC|nr:thioredoxin family protein [Salirhabdus salicampi]MCP8617669.1 thioredoxin family protein [Salirhabdus salicampi]